MGGGWGGGGCLRLSTESLVFSDIVSIMKCIASTKRGGSLARLIVAPLSLTLHDPA